MTVDESPAPRIGLARVLTPRWQAIGFMVGSTLFAFGSAPGVASWLGATTANVSFFIGAWFFTGAGTIQAVLSRQSDTLLRVSAWTQFVGTLLFNVSTSAALIVHGFRAEDHFVWSPDATGSVAFLISGVLGVVAFAGLPRDRDWFSEQVNLLGCVAFGVSAVGAFVTDVGASVDATLASVATFIGAVCFFVASMIVLPANGSDG